VRLKRITEAPGSVNERLRSVQTQLVQGLFQPLKHLLDDRVIHEPGNNEQALEERIDAARSRRELAAGGFNGVDGCLSRA